MNCFLFPFLDKQQLIMGDLLFSEQLVEIKRISVSRILCETTRITEIQEEAFLPPSIK